MSITFNGVNSDSLGVIVEKIPNPQIAARRVTTEIVPGRNGVLLQDDKSFATVNASYAMHISAEGGKLFPKARKVAAWLLATPGFLRLEDSYEDDVFRLARYNGGIDITSYFLDHGTFNCQFECQPQRFLKSGEIEMQIETPYVGSGAVVPGDILMPIPYGAISIYALASESNFYVFFQDADGQTVGEPLDTTSGTPTSVPETSTHLHCVWNNTSDSFSAVVGMIESNGNGTLLCGVSGVNPIVYNPTSYEARPLLKFVDTSTEPNPIQYTFSKTYGKGIGNNGAIAPASHANYISSEISTEGYAYAIVTGLGYSFFDSSDRCVAFYNAAPINGKKVIIPSTATKIVVGGSSSHEAEVFLQAARANPGTNAVTINGTTISLDFSAHDTVYLDCDLHDAYYLDGSSANDKVTFSSTIDKYPTFPGLLPGENTVIVRDGENLDFSIIPRWWVL